MVIFSRGFRMRTHPLIEARRPALHAKAVAKRRKAKRGGPR
jgi:hypothetical protein